ncbi:MAG: hypothetical protein BWY76_01339 [bacterium ADurb.Bin429]|nr:MAG: hypothetical protein BWY76_01339 [bacterium ADurb.Bin429]
MDIRAAVAPEAQGLFLTGEELAVNAVFVIGEAERLHQHLHLRRGVVRVAFRQYGLQYCRRNDLLAVFQLHGAKVGQRRRRCFHVQLYYRHRPVFQVRYGEGGAVELRRLRQEGFHVVGDVEAVSGKTSGEFQRKFDVLFCLVDAGRFFLFSAVEVQVFRNIHKLEDQLTARLGDFALIDEGVPDETGVIGDAHHSTRILQAA